MFSCQSTGCAKSCLAAAVHTKLLHVQQQQSATQTGKQSVGGAYFERRLRANVHKQHVVSLQHVLKHLPAGKSADSRPEREDTHSVSPFNSQTCENTHGCQREGERDWRRDSILSWQHHLVDTLQATAQHASSTVASQAFDQATL